MSKTFVNLDRFITTKLKEKYIMYSPYFMCTLMPLSNLIQVDTLWSHTSDHLCMIIEFYVLAFNHPYI